MNGSIPSQRKGVSILIEIKALNPDLAEAYFDFFDNRAFEAGSPYYPCYCNAFNMSVDEIKAVKKQAGLYGGGIDGWKRALREKAVKMVENKQIRGYLAFDKGIAIGWCNANARRNYYRVGEFDLDNVLDDELYDCQDAGSVKSVVCFEICPEYRGRGIATQLLRRVCDDARSEGYDFVEAYPMEQEQISLAFTGPSQLFEKAGFTIFSKGKNVIMRKALL